MRRGIAARLLTSKTTIPHFYLTIAVDAAKLMDFRAAANSASEAAGGPTLFRQPIWPSNPFLAEGH